jgi:hypothetical protein
MTIFQHKHRAIMAVGLALLSGCQTIPKAGGDSSSPSLVTSCLVGAGLGVLTTDALTNLLSGKKVSVDTATKRMMAGCVIGVAVTAIGKILNDRQKATYENALQRDAQRRAKEQEQYAAARSRAESRPARTPQQVAQRDAELSKLQKEYEASLATPVVADLGEGGTANITTNAPISTGDLAGCQTKIVLATTAAGQARQEELWCPGAGGIMERKEAKAL